MSSPLRRHSRRFAGSVKNLIYRLYPQGVSSPQLIDSIGTRLTDDDYCEEPGMPYCRNNGRCYSTNEGPNCDCTSDFEGRQCEKSNRFIVLMKHFWIKRRERDKFVEKSVCQFANKKSFF